MIAASSRLSGIAELIDKEQYFVIHAPRQSGKTTLLLDLTNRINHEGRYYALYCSLEVVQGIIDQKDGIRAVVQGIKSAYTKPVTAELVDKAIQTIILRRDTHIDSLLERLKEERVRRVIEPVIIGELSEIHTQSDDYRYATDLGLIREDKGVIMPSNPIYAEVIIRTLSADSQKDLGESKYPRQMPHYLKNGRIDMTLLLQEFQVFWRENSEIWVERYQYKEAAPHLILQAFLQRVINGGGQIIREFAAGRNRLDLCVEYEGKKYPIELKLRRSDKTEEETYSQITGYMDALGAKEGWLVIFDRRTKTKWDAKIYLKTETIEDKTVTIVGC
jgi:hypothetical protein